MERGTQADSEAAAAGRPALHAGQRQQARTWPAAMGRSACSTNDPLMSCGKLDTAQAGSGGSALLAAAGPSAAS